MNIYNKFLDFEYKNKLFTRKIFGKKYWEYIRPFVHAQINEKCLNISPVLSCNKKRLKDFFMSIFEFKKYFITNSIKNVDILLVSHPRRFLQEGLYKNIYIDPINDQLKKKYKTIVIEEPTWSSMVTFSGAHMFPIYTDNILYTDIYEFKYKIKSFIFKKLNRREYEIILKEYEYIRNLIIKEFEGYNINNICFDKIFIECILRLRLIYNQTNLIIKKLKPKIVLLHYFPSFFKTMLIDICNKNNICTTEIQHGTITADDPIVNKCRHIKTIDNATKYVFAFGNKQIDIVDSTVPVERIKYIGFPFLEEKIHSYIDIPDFMDKDHKYILIISQSTIGDHMSNFASELSELFNNNKEYKIIFKYHPNEASRNFECLNKENIIQIKDYKYDIYSIQRYSQCQIGVYSTALYEGVSQGIPTVILNNVHGCEEAKKILSYIKQGVYIIDTPTDFIKICDNMVKPVKEDLELLFTNNSLENIQREIEKILR